MSVMKQVVMNLSTRKYGKKKTQSRDLARPKSPKSLAIHLPSHGFETYDEPNIVKPGSISLTKDNPQWASKLKKKHAAQNTKFTKVYATATS